MQELAARYARAARPKPTRCLGLLLNPYSLGHALTLQAHDNSFLRREPSYEDLIHGVFVCSQSWESYTEKERSPFLGMFLKFWGFRTRKANLLREIQIFQDYIIDGNFFPEVNTPSKGRTMVCPWIARLKVELMIELGLSETEVLNRPLALSNIEYCAIGETNGTISMFSEKDAAFLEFHKKRMEEEQKGHAE